MGFATPLTKGSDAFKNEWVLLGIRCGAGGLFAIICFAAHMKVVAFGFSIVGSALALIGLQMIISGHSSMDEDTEFPLHMTHKWANYVYLAANVILFAVGFGV